MITKVLRLSALIAALAALAIGWRLGRPPPLEALVVLIAPVVSLLLDRSLSRALMAAAAAGLGALLAVAAGASLAPAAGAAWVIADRIGRDEGALRPVIAFAAACAVTALLYRQLLLEMSLPLLLGSLAGILIGPTVARTAEVHPLDRWSPWIFWCLASGAFSVAIARGASPDDLQALAAAVGLAILAAWIGSLLGLLTLASAFLAGAALRPQGPLAVAAVLAFVLLWARSSASLARIRAAVPGRAAADLATCFGAGYAPKGSGTAGAVTAIPVGWLLSSVDPTLRALILAAGTLASIGVAYWYMAGKTGDLDPKEVVLDEHIGVLLAFAVVPWEWPWVAAGFVLFRIFDIWKPFPVGIIDRRMKNPAGVMLDDVAAGLMAAGLLAAARAFI